MTIWAASPESPINRSPSLIFDACTRTLINRNGPSISQRADTHLGTYRTARHPRAIARHGISTVTELQIRTTRAPPDGDICRHHRRKATHPPGGSPPVIPSHRGIKPDHAATFAAINRATPATATSAGVEHPNFLSQPRQRHPILPQVLKTPTAITGPCPAQYGAPASPDPRAATNGGCGCP
jgi:hypothetical protein